MARCKKQRRKGSNMSDRRIRHTRGATVREALEGAQTEDTSMKNEAAQAAPLEDAPSTANGGASDSDPLTSAIQLQAYELFLSRGERHGDDLADWLEAERLVRFRFALPPSEDALT